MYRSDCGAVLGRWADGRRRARVVVNSDCAACSDARRPTRTARRPSDGDVAEARRQVTSRDAGARPTTRHVLTARRHRQRLPRTAHRAVQIDQTQDFIRRVSLSECPIPLHRPDPTRQSPRTCRRPALETKSGRACLV